jgi:hypothetical protein
VSEGVLEAAAGLREALAGFDPAGRSAEQCAVAVEVLAATAKACDAARVLAAVRAAECGAHRRRGFADPVDWLAQQTGSSAGAARDALDVARVSRTAGDEGGVGVWWAVGRPGGRDRPHRDGLSGQRDRPGGARRPVQPGGVEA